MDTLADILAQEEVPEDQLYDVKYQSNMYLIESALRETGADKNSPIYTRSPYDKELMRLINSVSTR